MRKEDDFPFTMLDDLGNQVRSGFAILVSNGRGGEKIWGDQIFKSLDGANSTAAACIPRECRIVLAREIIHRTERKEHKSMYFGRQIILGDDA